MFVKPTRLLFGKDGAISSRPHSTGEPFAISVVNVVSSLVDEAAGTTYSVRQLAKATSEAGCETYLHSLGRSGRPNQSASKLIETVFPVDYHWQPTIARAGLSRSLKKDLIENKRDIFHIHGLWMFPNVYPARAAEYHGSGLVLSPHGMLADTALRISPYLKKVFYTLWQRSVFDRVDCFRATSELELSDIRNMGFKQPVAIIPNGIGVKSNKINVQKNPWVISLGRVHPQKGLDRLVRAWANVESQFPHWTLKIIGPSQLGHREELKRLVQTLRLNRVEFMNPIFGDEKDRMLRTAELFVLPTLHENFAMTVAESLACGTPVISTTGAPWSGLVTHECGWWVEQGVQPLTDALHSAMSKTSEERLEMGQRGTTWMANDFQWSAIGQSCANLYRWIAHGTERPSFVVLD
jgi:glycosyltransferase involved in cell wall biosynthesis